MKTLLLSAIALAVLAGCGQAPSNSSPASRAPVVLAQPAPVSTEPPLRRFLATGEVPAQCKVGLKVPLDAPAKDAVAIFGGLGGEGENAAKAAEAAQKALEAAASGPQKCGEMVCVAGLKSSAYMRCIAQGPGDFLAALKDNKVPRELYRNPELDRPDAPSAKK